LIQKRGGFGRSQKKEGDESQIHGKDKKRKWDTSSREVKRGVGYFGNLGKRDGGSKSTGEGHSPCRRIKKYSGAKGGGKKKTGGFNIKKKKSASHT